MENLTMRNLVLGHNGLVGSAFMRRLNNTVTDIITETWNPPNGTTHCYMAAGIVGGIKININRPAEMLFGNLNMGLRAIAACVANKIKLLYLGSSCIYAPSEMPINEAEFCSKPLDDGNRGYAAAKVACIHACWAARKQFGLDYIAAMPCNLYGPNDRFSLENGHVIPALMMRLHQAKVKNLPLIEIWGDGSPLREFLFVDDLAEACEMLMDVGPWGEIINIGSGDEISIEDLAELLISAIGYKGEILWNIGKPNGVHRKVMDCSKLHRIINWQPKTTLAQGLVKTYRWFLDNQDKIRT